MITVIATDPSFGASYNIKKALSALDETILLCSHTDKWRKRPEGTITAVITPKNARQYLDKVSNSDLVFIVGGSSINILKMFPGHNTWVPNLHLVAWMTDSYYRKNSKYVNKQLQRWGCSQMFVQPDDTLYPLVPRNTLPLLHPISLKFPGEEKTKRVSVMHSPGRPGKRKQKGSDTIERVVRQLSKRFRFDYYCLMGMPHAACLKRKAQAHIFVDKLATSVSKGLGKSGLEAMASRCAVISSLHNHAPWRQYFTDPPVFRGDTAEQLESALRTLLMTPAFRKSRQEAARAWIEKYWGLENNAWLDYFTRYARL